MCAGSSRRYLTHLGFQVQHHQQAPYSDELPDQHTQLYNLRVGKLLMQAYKKGIVYRMVIIGQQLCILQGQAFARCKMILGRV
jgi:hypothetical protein